MTAAPPLSQRSWRGWGKFLLIGLGGYLVLTVGTIALVEGVQLSERLAYAIMITGVMIGNFYATRHVVFPTSRSGQTHRQALRFFAAAIAFRLLEFLLFSFLVGPLATPYVVAILLTSAVTYGLKYYVFSIWVFRA